MSDRNDLLEYERLDGQHHQDHREVTGRNDEEEAADHDQRPQRSCPPVFPAFRRREFGEQRLRRLLLEGGRKVEVNRL